MIITRPPAHRSTTAAGQASPATTNAADSNPRGGKTPTADGV
ncbi:putative mPS2 protein [Mycobacterium kansasii]|uniref:Putative mPS2 protein n=1 Tax=Mycobacterium kansasii TaxID=1768 RepID=A0A1V3XUN4_MYCKA|nr:putative mPS2 protein [Mycobacterium kansasii]